MLRNIVDVTQGNAFWKIVTFHKRSHGGPGEQVLYIKALWI